MGVARGVSCTRRVLYSGCGWVVVLTLSISCQTEKLISLLNSKKKLTIFDQAVRLPLNPSLKVIGLIPEECTLFKSALMPAKLCFLTENKDKYLVCCVHT